MDAAMKEWTPLNFATNGAHANVSKLLLDIGANTEATSEHGSTPLKSAAAISQ